eukprot:3932418-Rhodomonas_salina.1
MAGKKRVAYFYDGQPRPHPRYDVQSICLPIFGVSGLVVTAQGAAMLLLNRPCCRKCARKWHSQILRATLALAQAFDHLCVHQIIGHEPVGYTLVVFDSWRGGSSMGIKPARVSSRGGA